MYIAESPTALSCCTFEVAPLCLFRGFNHVVMYCVLSLVFVAAQMCCTVWPVQRFLFQLSCLYMHRFARIQSRLLTNAKS